MSKIDEKFVADPVRMVGRNITKTVSIPAHYTWTNKCPKILPGGLVKIGVGGVFKI